MDTIKNLIAGTVIVLIGGTAYTVSQSDIVENFATDTGLSHEQAEQYISEIPENELAAWDEVGEALVGEGQLFLDIVEGIDCANYEYEWESSTLSCSEGKNQLNKMSENYDLLGQSYIKLGSDSASVSDMEKTIQFIDQINSDYQLEIIKRLLDPEDIEEERKTNLYNRAILKAVIESE